MARKSVVKGKAFEREVANKLSRWVSHGKADNWFARSPESGGFSTRNKSEALLGDIVGINDPQSIEWNYQFIVECKRYKDLELGKAIYGTGRFVTLFEKHLDLCRDKKRQPLFFFQEDRRPLMVVFTSHGLDSLTGWYSITHSTRMELEKKSIWGGHGIANLVDPFDNNFVFAEFDLLAKNLKYFGFDTSGCE